MTSPASGHSIECRHAWHYFTKDPKDLEPLSCSVKSDFFDQMMKVKAILRFEQIINDERLDFEVDWYYCSLGLSRNYFEIHTAEEIAEHIGSLYSAKALAHVNGGELELQLQNRRKGRALFIVKSNPGHKKSYGAKAESVEHMIEKEYLGEGYHIPLHEKFSLRPTPSSSAITAPQQSVVAAPTPTASASSLSEYKPRYRLLCYRTKGTVAPSSDIHLRLYSLSEAKFPVTSTPVSPDETNLDLIADPEFLQNLDPYTKNIYQEAVKGVVGVSRGPFIKLYDAKTATGKEDANDPTIHLVVAYRSGSTHSFFSGMNDLYHAFNHYAPRKYIEQFSNGITVMNFQLYPRAPQFVLTKEQQQQLVEETNLVYILPRTSISSLFKEGILTAKEYAYAYAAWKFAFHFLSRQSSEFAELAAKLKNEPAAAKLLASIKSVVRKEIFSEGRIMETLYQYPSLVKELYKDFEHKHGHSLPNVTPGAGAISTREQWVSRIQKVVPSEQDRQIFGAFVNFNLSILKTNFYKIDKVALSFRLDPACFLSKDDYPLTPFGIFFVVGPEFRGFHIRFRDVARGGIRIIKSANIQQFLTNVTTLFDENYNLAHTQERKNKDIPEGGSKGTILLSLDHQDKAYTAFQKYVDSILDLLLVEQEPSIVDYYKQEEILFLGPDEGTANFMDWASQHAKARKYRFWKAFTTGKSREFGGIPHDMYGMTTRSIHQYVLGVLGKLGWTEENVTKLQTGGPDGDLGSNEIKISKDKTIAVVDGSGVLYDPEGLDRTSLVAVASRREMARKFDMSRLSPRGFFVDVDAMDVKLPDGTIVPSGLDFRNTFHLNPLASADIFVPCGGRPESINVNNVATLLNEDTKKPRFQVIVEGANLFLTQEARIILEKKGVVVFKDASANKGGVTSSSLEVLAALALTDQEFEQNMAVKNPNSVPAFYAEYIQEVHRIIEENARLEFQCIWNENQRTGNYSSVLSDVVSNKINELSTAIAKSDLWNANPDLRKKVLTEACPRNLLRMLGLETVLQRVPESYTRAIFAAFLASRYVYHADHSASPEFSFYHFISNYMKN